MVKEVSNVKVIKSSLWAILAVCTIVELVLFPRMENLMGCVVTFVSTWMFFTWVFNIEIIRARPISFIAFSHLFFFMYLPLPVTLLEGNEMSHNLYTPIDTFLLQLLYFAICVLAFNLAKRNSRGPNMVRGVLKYCGFFTTPTNLQLWMLGAIGLAFRLIAAGRQFGEEALAFGGTINMFSNLIYCPILILFGTLWGGEKCGKKTTYFIYGYIVFLVVLFVSTNSRSKMISPLIVFGSCYLLRQIYIHRTTLWMTKKKMIALIAAFFLITGPATDMSTAMLIVRSERSSMSFTELLTRSVEVFQDKKALAAYREAAEELAGEDDEAESENNTDWDEQYVSSPFLNRLCNYRVVDATIYHARRVGFADERMIDFFVDKLMTMFPGPITSTFFPNVSKEDLVMSSMDKLYNLSTGYPVGGFKVGGDVGIGLATFGYFYFPLCLVVYILVFHIFDSVIIYYRGQIIFSVFTLLYIYFTYFLKLQVATGLFAQVSFVLWGFWWTNLWNCAVLKIVRLFVRK